MINHEIAANLIKKQYSESIIVASYKLKNGYLFSIRPKDLPVNIELFDPFFKVSNDGIITEYSPAMDPSEFKEALKHRVV